MIQQFTARVLGALDRIYDIVGPVARVNAIDIAPPILVHDVSREAEYSTGFFCPAILQPAATDGAGTVAFDAMTLDTFLAQAEPVRELADRGLTRDEVDVWVCGWYTTIDNGDAGTFAHVRLGVRNAFFLTGVIDRILDTYTVVDGQPITTGGNLQGRTGPTVVGYGPIKLPFLMRDQVTTRFLMELADNTTGALVAVGVWDCWVGPKGVPPPVA